MNKKLPIVAVIALLTLSMLAGCSSSKQAAGPCSLRLEHVAINVPDPAAMAKWYCHHLGMKLKREGPPPANMRFIADPAGNMMLELYNNPEGAIPDYAAMSPFSLHIAFHVDDVAAMRKRLIDAGATPFDEIKTTDAGDTLTILRDPWGVPIQFLTRAKPMLK